MTKMPGKRFEPMPEGVSIVKYYIFHLLFASKSMIPVSTWLQLHPFLLLLLQVLFVFLAVSNK